MRHILTALFLVLGISAAHAQATVETCTRATVTGPCNATSTTNPLPVTVTSGGGASTVNQGTAGTNAQAWWVQIGDGANGPVNLLSALSDGVTATTKLGVWSQNYLFNGTTSDLWRDIPGALRTGFGTAAVAVMPTSSANAGITPTVTGAAANNLVLKASPGNLYSVYASNLTATAGFLVVLNSVSSPADGAITPLECVPLPANGNASINYNSGPPSAFTTGITAVVTSAATCFTKTTGTITAFIKGAVQ